MSISGIEGILTYEDEVMITKDISQSLYDSWICDKCGDWEDGCFCNISSQSLFYKFIKWFNS